MKIRIIALFFFSVGLLSFTRNSFAGGPHLPTTSEVLPQLADELFDFSAESEDGAELRKLITSDHSEEWEVIERSPDLLRVKATLPGAGEFTLRSYTVQGRNDEEVFVASGGHGANWRTRFFRWRENQIFHDSSLSPKFKSEELLLPGDSVANPSEIFPIVLLAETGELNVTPLTWMEKTWEQKSAYRCLIFSWDGTRFTRTFQGDH